MIATITKLIDWSAFQVLVRMPHVHGRSLRLEETLQFLALPTKRIATALLLLVTALCNTFGADTKNGPKSIPELQTAIETVLKETKTPGAAIAIVSRDKVEWMAGIGKADVAANQPVTADTLFRIGSVSKAFAALAALQLQEEGKLKLTDTVRQWVPEVAFVNPWEASDPLRLGHLMEHTTGFDDIHLREYALNDPTPIALKDALTYGAASRVCRWPPGARMAYCNSGPAVLAAVIEKVSGQRFEDYVQEHFFKPLHMDTASYFYTPEVEQRLTKLYHPDGITPYPYWHICFRPAGAINASAKDMANYVRFYLQRGSLDGTQLLQASSIERMETTKTLPSAKLGNVAGYGLYNYATFEGAFVFRGHNGGVMGGLTEMAYLPDYGRGYAVMINSGSGKALNEIGKLVRQYVIRDLTPPVLPPVASVPAELQRHYAGYYQGISPRVQLFYALERLINIGRLVFTATAGLSITTYNLHHEQWVPMTERLFRRENQSVATLALLPDADGETLIQCNFGTFKKVSALRVWGQRVAFGLIALLMLSSPLFALVWGSRRLFGKLHDAGPLSVRVMPLLSTILLGALFGLFAVKRDDMWTLGVCSWVTVGIMLSSIAFALAAAASLYVVYRERSAAMNRVAYWHSVLVAAAVAADAIYMGYWGLIGLRLWA
jgi:CubicO group peptidase (beta-lactamase class C family)